MWCEHTHSHISLGKTDEDEEKTLNQEAELEDAFGDSSWHEKLNPRPESDQDIEEIS